MSVDTPTIRYRVIGMDCAHDAADIERATRDLVGVRSVKVSAASHIMTLAVDDAAATLPHVEQAVAGLGYQLDPLREGGAVTHATPAYRRALWIVVLLNVGYGVVEMAAA